MATNTTYAPASTEQSVQRLDLFPSPLFDAPGVSIHETTGGVRLKGYATRVGVFPYRQADGTTVWELRPPEEVFNKESMDSLKSVAITLGHPTTFVDNNSYQRLNHGSAGDYQKIIDDTWIEVMPFIQTKQGLETVSDGVQELSCGYTSELVFKKGTWKGQKYDAIQTRIRYNHLAIVNQARLGKECRLMLDSLDTENENLAVLDTEAMAQQRKDSTEVASQPQAQNDNLTTVSLGGVVVSVPHEFSTTLAGIVTEKQQLKIRADELQVENGDLAQKVADLTAQLSDAVDKRSPEEVAENAVRLCEDAKTVNMSIELSNAIADPGSVMRQILVNIAPDYDTTQMNNDSLASAYNAAISVYRKNQNANPSLSGAIPEIGTNDTRSIASAPRGTSNEKQGFDKLIDIETNAYKRSRSQ